MAAIALSTTTDPPGTPHAVGAHRVYLKLSLFDEWAEVPALHCDSVTFAAAPSYSTAQLYWRYGVGKLPASLAFGTITRQGVLRYYVMIDFTDMTADGETPLGFFGTVEVDADRLDAATSGVQSLECYGMERLLDLQPVRSSWWEAPGDDANARESGSGFTFNAGGLPNRSATPEDGAFVFSHKSDAKHWTSRNIAQYLLKRHAAIDFGALTGEIVWELEDDDLNSPTWDRPVLDSHGRTVWELLNQLYPRQRMLSFITRLADDQEAEPGTLGIINIRPFTFAQEVIEIGDEAQIAANGTQHTLDVAQDHTATVVVTKSSLDVCDRVIVEGAPRTSTCTFLIDAAELEKGWPADLETEYEEGASEAGDYPASTEPADREERNTHARRNPRLAAVFARLALSEEFLSTQEIEGDPVFPSDDDEDVAHLAWPAALEILPDLSLLSGYSYLDGAIADDAVVAFTDGPHDRRPPLILTPLPNDPESDPELRQWVDVRIVGENAGLEADTDEIVHNWSAYVVMPPGDRSIVLEVHGEAQHVIAGAEFAALSALADHGERDIARYDYNEFTYTVTLQEDRRTHGRWPLGRVIPEIPRVKYLFAGDKYRCDYVVPGTVVDVFPATGVRMRSDGGYLRDDRPLLENIARAAFAWYGTQRSSVTITSSVLDPRLIPGVLLTTVNGRTVNACVTSLSIAIPRASGSMPGVPKYTYTTQFGELDVLALFPS